MIAVVVVVLIGVALAAAIVISRRSSDEAYAVSEQDQGPPGTVISSGDTELGTVSAAGTALAPYDGTAPDPAVGLVPPELT